MDDRIEQATAAPGEKRDAEIPHEKRCHVLMDSGHRCELKIGHAGYHQCTVVMTDGE